MLVRAYMKHWNSSNPVAKSKDQMSGAELKDVVLKELPNVVRKPTKAEDKKGDAQYFHVPTRAISKNFLGTWICLLKDEEVQRVIAAFLRQKKRDIVALSVKWMADDKDVS